VHSLEWIATAHTVFFENAATNSLHNNRDDVSESLQCELFSDLSRPFIPIHKIYAERVQTEYGELASALAASSDLRQVVHDLFKVLISLEQHVPEWVAREMRRQKQVEAAETGRCDARTFDSLSQVAHQFWIENLLFHVHDVLTSLHFVGLDAFYLDEEVVTFDFMLCDVHVVDSARVRDTRSRLMYGQQHYCACYLQSLRTVEEKSL